MKPAIQSAVRTADLVLLRAAWLIVPRAQRADWWREWYAELWQVRREYAFDDNFSWDSECAIARFCCGAFQDALYLRRVARRKPAHLNVRFGSAWQCLLLLAAFFCATYFLARSLPGVRVERSLTRSGVRPGLLLIENVTDDSSPRPISSGQYRAWTNRKQQFFDGFAFYRVTKENVNWRPVEDSSHVSAGWGVARASSNFFTFLGLPVQFQEAGPSAYGDMPAVVLSERLWKREFGADPHVAGSLVQLGSRWATIAGVAVEGPSSLPGNVDAWLLEPESQITPAGPGYVVAHLSPLGRQKVRSSRVQITSFAPRRTPDDMLGIAITNRSTGQKDAFWFGLLLALLALPAVSSVSLSELTVSVHRISWQRRALRWGFLSIKLALVVLSVYFASLDLAYGITWLTSYQSLYVLALTSFIGCLAGITWALSDQRRRCPVCLCRVVHPARVGQFSRTFLAWSGTELMCMRGHTLLHVPSLPTSWFSEQRWMLLDQSWEFLFAAPTQE